ncbi:hypothetical protein O1L55_40980 [Streptomyces albulus]|nr:hypothetical protein [Streptomyces noursei]
MKGSHAGTGVVLGELSRGVTDTRFVRDVEQAVGWIRDGGQEPDTIAESSFQEQRLHRLTSRNSAAYKGIHAAASRRGRSTGSSTKSRSMSSPSSDSTWTFVRSS